jgi:hypothetical protein
MIDHEVIQKLNKLGGDELKNKIIKCLRKTKFTASALLEECENDDSELNQISPKILNEIADWLATSDEDEYKSQEDTFNFYQLAGDEHLDVALGSCQMQVSKGNISKNILIARILSAKLAYEDAILCLEKINAENCPENIITEAVKLRIEIEKKNKKRDGKKPYVEKAPIIKFDDDVEHLPTSQALDDTYFDSILDQVALNFQRTVNQIKISDEVHNCCIIPIKPDGNCGFSAIRKSLELQGKDEITAQIYRTEFIQLISFFNESAKDDKFLMNLIHSMYQVDGATDFENWSKKFKSSGYWVNEVHFKILSYHFNIIINIFYIDSESNYFKPEPTYESINECASENPTSVFLAHLSLKLKNKPDANLNHFESIIIEPTEKQLLIIKELIEQEEQAYVLKQADKKNIYKYLKLRPDSTSGIRLSFDSLAFYRMLPIRVQVTIGYDRPKDECFLYIEIVDKNDSAYSSLAALDGCFYNSVFDINFNSYIPPEFSSLFDKINEMREKIKDGEEIITLPYPQSITRKKGKNHEDLLRFLEVFSRYKIYIPIEIYEILSDDQICCVNNKIGYSVWVEDVSMRAYDLYQENTLSYYKEFYRLLGGLDYIDPLGIKKNNEFEKDAVAEPSMNVQPKKNRLTLGEADFSFSAAFMRKHAHRKNFSKKVIATEYRKKDEVSELYNGWELYWIKSFNDNIKKNNHNAVVFVGRNKADLRAYFIEAIESRKEVKYVFKKSANGRDNLSIKISFMVDHEKISFDDKTGKAIRTYETVDIIDNTIKEAITRAKFQPNVHYISFPTHQIHLDQLGVAMQFGVDAQNIHEIFAGEHFTRIHFNCPHDKQDSRGRTLPKMLVNFFNSAKFLQRIGDRINMALPTPFDKEQRQNRESYIYKVYDAAASAGYRLVKKRKFGDQRYPGYWHVMTGKSKTAEVAEHLREYIFEKIEPNDDESTDVIHYKSPTSQKTHYVGKPHQDVGHVLPESIETDDDSSDYDSSDDEKNTDRIMKALKIEDNSNQSIFREIVLQRPEITPSLLKRASAVSSEYHSMDAKRTNESGNSHSGLPSTNITTQFSNFKISRQQLEEAIDFMISIEPDPEIIMEHTDYKKIMKKHAKKIQEAELIVKQYGNQIADEEMQNEFYSIVQSKKYRQSAKHQSVAYTALNDGWHGIKGWQV